MGMITNNTTSIPSRPTGLEYGRAMTIFNIYDVIYDMKEDTAIFSVGQDASCTDTSWNKTAYPIDGSSVVNIRTLRTPPETFNRFSNAGRWVHPFPTVRVAELINERGYKLTNTFIYNDLEKIDSGLANTTPDNLHIYLEDANTLVELMCMRESGECSAEYTDVSVSPETFSYLTNVLQTTMQTGSSYFPQSLGNIDKFTWDKVFHVIYYMMRYNAKTTPVGTTRVNPLPNISMSSSKRRGLLCSCKNINQLPIDLIKRLLINNETLSPTTYDIDGDGVVTIYDIILIYLYARQWTSTGWTKDNLDMIVEEPKEIRITAHNSNVYARNRKLLNLVLDDVGYHHIYRNLNIGGIVFSHNRLTRISLPTDNDVCDLIQNNPTKYIIDVDIDPNYFTGKGATIYSFFPIKEDTTRYIFTGDIDISRFASLHIEITSNGFYFIINTTGYEDLYDYRVTGDITNLSTWDDGRWNYKYELQRKKENDMYDNAILGTITRSNSVTVPVIPMTNSYPAPLRNFKISAKSDISYDINNPISLSNRFKIRTLGDRGYINIMISKFNDICSLYFDASDYLVNRSKDHIRASAINTTTGVITISSDQTTGDYYVFDHPRKIRVDADTNYTIHIPQSTTFTILFYNNDSSFNSATTGVVSGNSISVATPTESASGTTLYMTIAISGANVGSTVTFNDVYMTTAKYTSESNMWKCVSIPIDRPMYGKSFMESGQSVDHNATIERDIYGNWIAEYKYMCYIDMDSCESYLLPSGTTGSCVYMDNLMAVSSSNPAITYCVFKCSSGSLSEASICDAMTYNSTIDTGTTVTDSSDDLGPKYMWSDPNTGILLAFPFNTTTIHSHDGESNAATLRETYVRGQVNSLLQTYGNIKIYGSTTRNYCTNLLPRSISNVLETMYTQLSSDHSTTMYLMVDDGDCKVNGQYVKDTNIIINNITTALGESIL